MSILRIRYQTMLLGLLGGLFAAQAQRCAGEGFSVGPTGLAGLWLGFFLGLAPGFLYQRFVPGCLLALLGSLAGLVGGTSGQALYERFDRQQMAAVGLVVGYSLLGTALGAMTGVAPAEIHWERSRKGAYGGLVGGLIAGAFQAATQSEEVAPLLRWAVTGLLIGGISSYVTWSSRQWLLCRNPSPYMPCAFPLYERAALCVGRRFHPAHVCLPDDPLLATAIARIIPGPSVDGNRTYYLYAIASSPLFINQVRVVERSRELGPGHVLEVGGTQFEVSRHPSIKTPLRTGQEN